MTALHEFDGTPTEDEFLERDVVMHPQECGPCEDCAAAGFKGGGRVSGIEPSSYRGLLKHAQNYGTDGVWETAEQSHLSEADLARLRIELDALEGKKKSSAGFSIGKKRRRSQAETIEACRALKAEGATVEEIADKLGLKLVSAKWYLKKAEKEDASA